MLGIFLRDSAIYVVPTLISRGLALLLLPLYTRILSSADYGSMDLFLVFASLVNVTVALEVSQGVARFFAAERDLDRKTVYASTAFWFTLLSYGLATAVMLSFAQPLSQWIMGQPQQATAFRIGAAYILFNGIFYLIQSQLRWELRSKAYAATSLFMSLVTALASVVLGYVMALGLEGLLAGMVIGCASGNVLGLWLLRHSFQRRFDMALLHEMLTFSTPLVVSGLAVWIGLYVDRVMISHLLSIEDVGVYGIGYRVASIASLVVVGFQGALTPLVYAHHQDPGTPRQLARIFRIFTFFSCATFLLLALFAQDILQLLTSETFYSSGALVIYLVPAMLLASMYIFAPGIGIAKKTHLFIWINAGGALLNITLNYLLLPRMGVIGAGMASLSTHLTVFCVYMTLSQRLYPIPHQWGPVVMAALITSALAWGVPMLTLQDGLRWSANIFAITIFFLSTVLLGLVRPDEVREATARMRAFIRPSSSGDASH